MSLEFFMKNLSDISCVSGEENKIETNIKNLFTDYKDVNIEVDKIGNIIITKHATKSEKTIVFDSHIDEIGMVITDITSDGFLKIAASGGLDPKVCVGAEVLVGKEKITGIVCMVPPHLKKQEDNQISEVVKMFVDVGFTYQEALQKFSPGDKITWKRKFEKISDFIYAGSAFDNRAGCAACCYCLELLKNINLKLVDLKIIFSAMEEVGSDAAGCSISEKNLSSCIVIDTTFGAINEKKEPRLGKLGKGPMLGISPILNEKSTTEFKKIIKDMGEPYQLEVMGGKTGTNADKIIEKNNFGKPVLISIPIRYMHSQIELIDIRDVETTAKLLAKYIIKADKKE